MGLTLLREGDSAGFLLICPQPEEWLQSHPSDRQLPLAGFDTNGTAHRYVLEWSGGLLSEAQRQALAESFTLALDAGLISQLIHDSYENDMAAAIAYLPYLSWSSYRGLYGEEGLEDLLTALWAYAGSGEATWDQAHNILSIPVDEAIDGAYATAYQDLLWALYQADAGTFTSILGSGYLTGAERDNAVSWLRMPLAEERGLSQALSPAEAQAALGLGGGGSDTPESAPAAMTDGEVMNGIMRGYAPGVMEVGSPQALEADLTGDWTLAGIQAALFEALSLHLSGTYLEGDLVDVAVSYAFQFPADLRDGTVLTVPYTATYRGDLTYLPSGAAYAPDVTTGTLTATVRLVGQGATAPVDEAFSQGQAVYQKLSGCTQSIALEAVSGGSFDLAPAAQAAIEAKLEAADLAEDYRISALALGSYTAPASLSPGAVQAVSGTVSFIPASEDGFAIPALAFTLTCTTVAG